MDGLIEKSRCRKKLPVAIQNQRKTNEHSRITPCEPTQNQQINQTKRIRSFYKKLSNSLEAATLQIIELENCI